MQVLDIKAFANRKIRLTPRAWAMAVLLGRARERSNQQRALTSDRGEVGNQTVDLHGALGELILLRQALLRPESDDVAAYMRRHMFNPSGGRDVEGPDLELQEDGIRYGIYIKSFDCLPNKSFFAINGDKHRKLAGCCAAYLGLIAPRYCQKGVLTRLMPYDDVEMWELRLTLPLTCPRS